MPVVPSEEGDLSLTQTWSQTGTLSQRELVEASRPLNRCLLLFSPTLSPNPSPNQTTLSMAPQREGEKSQTAATAQTKYSGWRMVHLFLPSASCFLCTSCYRFLLRCEILLETQLSYRSPRCRIMSGVCVCVRVVTWSLFLPESDSEGVGSDSEGDPLSTSRSLDDPRTFFGGGGR